MPKREMCTTVESDYNNGIGGKKYMHHPCAVLSLSGFLTAEVISWRGRPDNAVAVGPCKKYVPQFRLSLPTPIM